MGLFLHYIYLLQKLPPWKLESWIAQWSFFLLRLLYVYISLLYVWVWNSFFNCYLAVPWPTLGHYQEDSLTHPMSITFFLKKSCSNRYLIFWYLVQCMSLVEATVQNFRLLFLAETDLKSFLRHCNKLWQWNKQTMVEYYSLVFTNHEIMSWFHKDLNDSEVLIAFKLPELISINNYVAYAEFLDLYFFCFVLLFQIISLFFTLDKLLT